MKKDLSFLICGEAGQGVQTVELLLTKIFKESGFNVFATKEYMSRVRGGSNSIEIRIASEKVRAPVYSVDIAILLDKGALGHVKKRLTDSTVVLAEKETIGPADRAIVDVPLHKEAALIGGAIYANIIAVGVVAGIVGIDRQIVLDRVGLTFAGKAQDVVEKNHEAVRRGYALAETMAASGAITKERFSSLTRGQPLHDQILCNGAESIGLGALAGGCNFISSYPMSPSTGVLVFLAQRTGTFNIIAEQAEDEIAAINMAIGAWYAGARALVTTSGGGFALMEEGVSLAAMLETPLVAHIAQRPGPATGLPTRTEQGDLELVLYSGHGEFPRAIFAPGSVEDAFLCGHRAFYVADKYQIPVFILTDQYLMDSYYNCAPFSISGGDAENHIVRTDAAYKRYRLADNGISPRGIPGYGDGLVLVDSDEHDEEGRITENMDVRNAMVEKRLKKLDLVIGESLGPELIGSAGYKTLVICWGSTYPIVEEAIKRLGRDDIALLYFKQVYPLHKDTAGYIQKAKKTVLVENNATGQFGKLLKLTTGIDIKEKILKYDGLPFFVDELAGRLKGIV